MRVQGRSTGQPPKLLRRRDFATLCVFISSETTHPQRTWRCLEMFWVRAGGGGGEGVVTGHLAGPSLKSTDPSPLTWPRRDRLTSAV